MKNLLKALGAAAGYIAIYFLTIFVVSFGAMIVGIFMGIRTPDEGLLFLTSNLLEINIVADLLTLIIVLLIQKLRKRKLAEYLDVKPVSLGHVWPLVLFGFSFNFIIDFLITFLPLPQKMIDDYASAAGVLNVGSPWVSLIATVLVAPLFEEMMFRGLILNIFKKAMPLWVAVVLQAIVFGLMHGQILWAAYSFLFGIILAIVRIRFGSILACITLHFAFNALSAILMVLHFDPGSFLWSLLLFAASIGLAAFSAWRLIKYKRGGNTSDQPVVMGAIDSNPSA